MAVAMWTMPRRWSVPRPTRQTAGGSVARASCSTNSAAGRPAGAGARAATQQLFYARMVSLAEDTLWSELLEVAERKRIRQLVALNRRAPVKLDYDADFRKASGL